jgi:hypothetical protein
LPVDSEKLDYRRDAHEIRCCPNFCCYEKSLGVTKQSTVVVFKDGKESARSTGDTQQASLAVLLHRGIS